MTPSEALWLSNGIVLSPGGEARGAVCIKNGRIVAIRKSPPPSAQTISVGGRFISPGFIDLHVWGPAPIISKQEAKTGTTAFLASIGPRAPEILASELADFEYFRCDGAKLLGVHLEGPFLNPLRAGALASRWLRPPTSRELRQIMEHSKGRLKLITMAPEIPRGSEAIRWFARRGVSVSLGHTDASDAAALRAIKAGARAVTHVFNGMRSLHHRDPGLLGEALTDDRLMAMAIVDGIHVEPTAFRLLLRCKGPDGVILVTDSIKHQNHPHLSSSGAFYTKKGILAGSRLSMIQAVRNAVKLGGVSINEAVRMASANPARLLGLENNVGSLREGAAADIAVFDKRFRVFLTIVDGRIAYRRSR
jgi:N-acetylglucosamine-6-phosphate deacetylase